MAKNTRMAKSAVTAEASADEAVVAVVPTGTAAKTDNVQSVEMKRRGLLKHYKAEKKVPVNISPMYAKYFGKVMTVAINGITVAIPCDGKTYQITKTHATEALSRVRKIDASIRRKTRMQDASNNLEYTPGEIKFY